MHDRGRGRMALEPVFIARKSAASEDLGWVLSYVYDANEDTSDAVILNAQHLAEAPLATIQLPVRVAFKFHGAWSPDADSKGYSHVRPIPCD